MSDRCFVSHVVLCSPSKRDLVINLIIEFPLLSDSTQPRVNPWFLEPSSKILPPNPKSNGKSSPPLSEMPYGSPQVCLPCCNKN